VIVRRLSVGDEALAAAAVRSFADADDAGGAPIDVGPFLSSPACVLLVSLSDGAVTGWVYGHELVHPDGERTMLLYALDVDERFHRLGHGRALVSAFVEEARSAGCTEVWVLTDDDNVAANATYRSAGGKREVPDSVMYTWFIAPGREAGADQEE
jgi:ribosomal protein S18 acetylase RimI-like enzyme